MSEAQHPHHPHPNYVRIWAILVVLLMISVIGPMFGIRVVTLITAFGIACVKAYLVAKNFMHINLARRFVIYGVTTVLVFMLLFFAGTAPDVMKPSGSNWMKPGWHEVAIGADLTGAGQHAESAAPASE
jgi:caa(3)-type oxidase subunit IV